MKLDTTYDDNRRKAYIKTVKDGDTVVCDIVKLTVGKEEHMWNNVDVRLTIINCPDAGEDGRAEAKQFTEQFLGQTVSLTIYGKEKYGRLLADVYVTYQGERQSLSSLLLFTGHADVYGKKS